MNIYLIVIIGSMLAALALQTTATVLNLRGLDPNLPAEFAGWYDPAEYARSQHYSRAKGRLELIASVGGTAALIAVILLGGFDWADRLARGLGQGTILTGLAYYALLGAAAHLAGQPLALYRVFVLEERFGFNRTTLRTYLADQAKGMLLTAAIGGPLAAMVLWFFQAAGAWAWLWAWMGTTTLSLVLQYLAPSLLMPLFHTFTPLAPGPLREALEEYATRVGFELSGIFVIDGSRRSSKANAFFTGFGKRKRIALYDTLVNTHTPEEITAVLAHEVGHHRRGHIPRMLAVGTLHTGVLFLLMSLFLDNRELFDAFGMSQVSVYAGLVFFLLLYSPVSTLLGIGVQALSRRHEFQADAFAAQSTGKPESLANALKRLSVTSLSNLTPHPLEVMLNYSHPPVLERIAQLRLAGDGTGSGASRGAEPR